jgi:hypothetical protein
MQETDTLPFPTITGVWERRRGAGAGRRIGGNINKPATALRMPVFALK